MWLDIIVVSTVACEEGFSNSVGSITGLCN